MATSSNAPLLTMRIKEGKSTVFVNVNPKKPNTMTLSITKATPSKSGGKTNYKRVAVSNPNVMHLANAVKKAADFIVKHRKKK